MFRHSEEQQTHLSNLTIKDCVFMEFQNVFLSLSWNRFLTIIHLELTPDPLHFWRHKAEGICLEDFKWLS